MGNLATLRRIDDDTYGFVASLGLNPQKSRVLPRLALLNTTDVQQILRYFEEYWDAAAARRIRVTLVSFRDRRT